jgi:phosphatidate cytidylyltransferase
MSEAARWSDLGPRIASAVVLIAVGGLALWAGTPWFDLLVIALAAAGSWELARLAHGPGIEPVMVGLVAAAALFLTTRFTGVLPAGLLLATILLSAPALRRGRLMWLAYAPVVLIGAYALIEARRSGLFWIGWLVALVIATDIAGYFAGRLIGGPKFWPRLSPKKTWAGIVAGWIAAALVGAGFAAMGGGGMLVAVSPMLAFASQLGDIAESAVKRRAGVKDASALIPGHGGVLDRFDALLGAAVALFVAGALSTYAG